MTGLIAALLLVAAPFISPEENDMTGVFVRARRRLHSRSRRWLLYPVLAVLAVASVGGGCQTVREEADASAYPSVG